MTYDREHPREWAGSSYRSEMGRSSILIRCPFRDASFVAYIWSISGGGKKCPHRGAFHGSTGQAYAVLKALA